MKNKISVMLVALVLISGAARAQWPVTDLAGLTQSIINSSNEMVQTSSTAQTMVQNFQETQKIYDQSKKYYDTLKKVKNLVRQRPEGPAVYSFCGRNFGYVCLELSAHAFRQELFREGTCCYRFGIYTNSSGKCQHAKGFAGYHQSLGFVDDGQRSLGCG